MRELIAIETDAVTGGIIITSSIILAGLTLAAASVYLLNTSLYVVFHNELGNAATSSTSPSIPATPPTLPANEINAVVDSINTVSKNAGYITPVIN